MYATPDGKLHVEWFDGDDSIEAQMSRYRFVYAGVPDQLEAWKAIQREYAQITARRAAYA